MSPHRPTFPPPLSVAPTEKLWPLCPGVWFFWAQRGGSGCLSLFFISPFLGEVGPPSEVGPRLVCVQREGVQTQGVVGWGDPPLPPDFFFPMTGAGAREGVPDPPPSPSHTSQVSPLSPFHGPAMPSWPIDFLNLRHRGSWPPITFSWPKHAFLAPLEVGPWPRQSILTGANFP